MTRNIYGLLCTAIILFISMCSCALNKEVQYMQDIQPGTLKNSNTSLGLLIEPDDLLSIIVTTKDPELGTLFNLQPGTINADFHSSNGSTNRSQQNVDYGYRVDALGNIVFPLLGEIHVSGLTRAQLETLIKNRILKEGLLKDFSVSVSFLNSRISIIGDVRSPGNYDFKDDKYTLLQALADAGDLNITAKRVVTVVRDKNGKRQVYEVDLKSRELFDSPAYYLQQNDVIYVIPNEKKAAESDSNASQWRQISTWMGLMSFVASMVTIVIAITK